jgi:hypothetical protein
MFTKEIITKPVCTITKQDACDDDQKEILRTLQAKSKDELLADQKDVEDKVNELQKDLDDFIQLINQQYDVKSTEVGQKLHELHTASNYKWITQVLHTVHGVAPKKKNSDEDEDEDVFDEGGSGDEL